MFLFAFLASFLFSNQIEISLFSPRDLIFQSQPGTNIELLVQEHYLKPGFVVFDVGANIGEWSASALSFHPSLRLFAFEPIPEVFQHTKVKNPIELHHLAFSDHVGRGSFYYLPFANGLSSLYNRKCFSNDVVQVVEVELDTIDHFCAVHQIGRIDYLKIDSEGAELAILKGAQGLLRGGQITALQFEYGGCYEDAATQLKQVAKLLTDAGYVLFKMTPFGLKHMMHIARWHPCLENYGYCDYFAILQSEVPEYETMKNIPTR